MSLLPNGFNERINLLQRHSIHGFGRGTAGERTMPAIESTIGSQVQFSVEQLSKQILKWQSSLATFLNHAKHSFGIAHLAHLPSLV
jgi:hypothetical protein